MGSILETLSCPVSEWIPLWAGPLQLAFDPQTVAIRYVRLGEKEILRSIYGAVRDCNWGTVRPRLSNLRLESSENSFHMTFTVDCEQDEIQFQWEGRVTGDLMGHIRFGFEGTAGSRFLRNRIGLCVLHPLEGCVGQPCAIEHGDGQSTHGAFPDRIAAFQPFKDIRKITHRAGDGIEVEVLLTGDTFEMEDQRNWSDASFKTYSTPLALPFPVLVEEGSQIRQEVRLSLRGVPGPVTVAKVELTRLQLPDATPRLTPPLGLCLASHGESLSIQEANRLRSLRLSHLRVDIDFAKPDWRDQLRRAEAESLLLDVGLHVAIHLTDRAEAELSDLLGMLTATRPRILLWCVFHHAEKCTSERTVTLARERLRRFDSAIPWAAGTPAYFAEWNRGWKGLSGVLPCYSVNPQVHGDDDATLVENLGGLSDTVSTAWERTREPVVVSPVTLRPRFNPNATAASGKEGAGDRLPPEVDVRQALALGAAWTLGSVGELSRSSALHSLTYYETTGWKGIMETRLGPAVPQLFPSRGDAVFPMFHIFRALAGFPKLLPLTSSDALSATGLALWNEAGILGRLVMANLRGTRQTVRVEVPWRAAVLRVLDSEAGEALLNPEGFWSGAGDSLTVVERGAELSLPPYAVAIIEPAPVL